MKLLHIFTILIASAHVFQCDNYKRLTIIRLNQPVRDDYCTALEGVNYKSKLADHRLVRPRYNRTRHPTSPTTPFSFKTSSDPPPERDPLQQAQGLLHYFLYGCSNMDDKKGTEGRVVHTENSNNMIHYPSGGIRSAQLFRNKSSVHMPNPELLHRNYCKLRVNRDYMQTAVNAFAIILEGGLDDIKRLPPDYVLLSARAISMMRLSREKFAAMWTVVLADNKPDSIRIDVLEKFRPLFKYLNGKQIARLDLTDERIVNYIGTHPDLNRHQVGVVASKYMKLNPHWSQPKYLNIMNNLLCGVPMTYMRKVPDNTYLQLAHQVFYHIRACDPLQKRFYLNMVTKTQALGKAYSWSARDVSRLGLLIAEVDGADLAAINPESMAGLTAQVMNEIPEHKLVYITEMQYRYIRQKPLNILARKLKNYHKAVLASTAIQLKCHFLNSISTVFLLLSSK